MQRKSKTTGRFSTLTARENAARERALALLSELRRGEASYSTLLRKHHIDTRTARRHLGRELVGGTNGKPVRASKADRLVRELMFPTSVGDAPIRVRGSKNATKLSDYFRDRARLLRGKLSPADFEAKWRGVRIAGREVLADADRILQMANADVLKIENMYASTGGER